MVYRMSDTKVINVKTQCLKICFLKNFKDIDLTKNDKININENQYHTPLLSKFPSNGLNSCNIISIIFQANQLTHQQMNNFNEVINIIMVYS